jgi:hypothetical protein
MINTNKKNNIGRNSNPLKKIEADLTTKVTSQKDKIEEVRDKTVNEIYLRLVCSTHLQIIILTILL